MSGKGLGALLCGATKNKHICIMNMHWFSHTLAFKSQGCPTFKSTKAAFNVGYHKKADAVRLLRVIVDVPKT